MHSGLVGILEGEMSPAATESHVVFKCTHRRTDMEIAANGQVEHRSDRSSAASCGVRCLGIPRLPDNMQLTSSKRYIVIWTILYG